MRGGLAKIAAAVAMSMVVAAPVLAAPWDPAGPADPDQAFVHLLGDLSGLYAREPFGDWQEI